VYEDEPLERVIKALECHLLEEHSFADFELERDLLWEHNRPDSPRAIYLPEVERRPPGFICQECGSRIFSTPSFGSLQRNQALRQAHASELSPLLRGLAAEDQERVIEDWDRGRLAAGNLERIGRKDAQRVKQARDPATTRRIERCQRFLLDHYHEHANKEEAIDALIALAKEDPDRHYEIVGQAYALGRDALSRYWKLIPIAERQAAKAEGLARKAQAKADRLAQARRKLTP
jgi:hypothetical protein